MRFTVALTGMKAILAFACVIVRTVQTCGNPVDAVPLFRAFNPATGDHFYITNATEMGNAVASERYTREQDAARIFETEELSTVPFYRLFNPVIEDHFYTVSEEERDGAIASSECNDEGVPGYVYVDEGCGGEPFFRLFNQEAGDHFYTMSEGEVEFAETGGYVFEKIAAFTLEV
ncbi:hypothetical protein K435DRAFT_819805 [Dendrothele bispora CBS 962.96]|uniref:DUF5648 domain-containing protein n=1 Tax=Dendrothele bispora (strain CBS 962.96) TaxID=1314807 RepID=A0A4S8LZN8_DENBC|nr:hypothetical protein K435DRAFT_819805 [Dendrothele bispora CBS 962.96]